MSYRIITDCQDCFHHTFLGGECRDCSCDVVNSRVIIEGYAENVPIPDWCPLLNENKEVLDV